MSNPDAICFVCDVESKAPHPENNYYWAPANSTGWWRCENDCCNVLRFNRGVLRAYVQLTSYREENYVGLVIVEEIQTRYEDGGSRDV